VPVTYERDDIKHRVVITFPGEYQTADGMAAIEQHHAAGVWTYGVLYDLRSLKGHPNVADLKAYMERDVQPPAGETRPRGPIAILTADPIVYGLACTYAALARSTMTIQVFRDWPDADHWLIAQTSLLT
jgi:hypothetical protein